jgi:hypothetical protein
MSTGDDLHWRCAIQFRIDDSAAIYASWPFGHVRVTTDGVTARIQPAWVEAVAGRLSGSAVRPLQRSVPWAALDAVEVRGRRLRLRSADAGDLQIIGWSVGPISEIVRRAEARGVACIANSKTPLAGPSTH